MKSLLRRSAALIVGGLIAAAAPTAASATDFTIASYGIEGGSQWGYVTYGSTTEAAWIGRITLQGANPADNFLTWCLDVFDTLKAPAVFTQSTLTKTTAMQPSYSSTQLGNVIALMTNIDQAGLNMIAAGAQSAAAQLAIWELLTEDTGTYDVSTGSFHAAGGSLTASAISQANTWLTSFNTSTPIAAKSGQEIVMLSPNGLTGYTLGAGNQPQIYTRLASLNATGAVPEPATWLMTILGFGAMGATMRRRRTTETAIV